MGDLPRSGPDARPLSHPRPYGGPSAGLKLRPVGGREEARGFAPALPSRPSPLTPAQRWPSSSSAPRVSPAYSRVPPRSRGCLAGCDVTRPRPLAINTGVSGTAFPHSLALLAAEAFPFFTLLLPSLPLFLSRSAALRCDEAESSPHSARVFPFLPTLLHFSPAAAATAAQLVSVPRFSPHVVPAAYGPGRLGYFCSR